MILLSSYHQLNNWYDEWPGFSGLTYDYWFTHFPLQVRETIAENDNG